MMLKEVHENYLEEETEKKDKEKSMKSDVLKRYVKNMGNVVKQLEDSLMESHQNDRQLLMSVNLDNIKNQKLKTELEEARKENKQLINMMQQQCYDSDLSRSISNYDLSPTYSVSIVHLQYKYEELLKSHEGLLKLLQSRIKETQKCCTENEQLQDNIKNLNYQLMEYEKYIQKLCNKYFLIKQKKDAKITRLRTERNTLWLVHEQLVSLLHKQCMEKDCLLLDKLHNTIEPYKALLLQEVRKTNLLRHENCRLRQEMAHLQSKLSHININNKT